MRSLVRLGQHRTITSFVVRGGDRPLPGLEKHVPLLTTNPHYRLLPFAGVIAKQLWQQLPEDVNRYYPDAGPILEDIFKVMEECSAQQPPVQHLIYPLPWGTINARFRRIIMQVLREDPYLFDVWEMDRGHMCVCKVNKRH